MKTLFQENIFKFISDHNEFLKKIELANLNCNDKELLEKDLLEFEFHITLMSNESHSNDGNL